ncbi:MAG: DUF4412 domain-containing protein [Verrucomicrobia bacterium]|nr:DUF4412 domain-containing protein [Verrucomicrobiota bacterium]
MKQWVVGWILLCCPLVWADLVVVQKVEESGPGKQTGVITLKTKGDKIRVDLSPEISLLMDTTSGETITLQHGQKTYLSVSSDAARQLARKMERQRESQEREGIVPAPVRLEPTGKRENIAGQATQIYTAQSGAVKMKYWIAQNSPDTGKFLDLLALLRKAPMVQLAGGLASLAPDFKLPGIPLKTEMSLPDGRKITTTIVSIQEEPLENLDFTVPPGYRSLPKPKFGADPPLKSP